MKYHLFDQVLPALQLFAWVVILLFAGKAFFNWLQSKYPNNITTALNTVVQSA